jgi:cardiolipin synthase
LFGWEFLTESWQAITAWGAVLNTLLVLAVIPWVLAIKREATSAVAWCLLVLLVPYFGAVFFYLFGYQSVHRPLKRKRKHKLFFRLAHPSGEGAEPGGNLAPGFGDWATMARLAHRLDAFPLTFGNRIALFHSGQPAYEAMLAAIAAAQHHVHMQFFIFEPDASGQRFLAALADRARAGVEVRFLYDAMGSYTLRRRLLRQLVAAGGKYASFLPINPLRRRLQVNLRNHRKILVVDGRVAFTGGLNIGDEYLGRNPRFGPWRDTHLRAEGPAVESLQRVFIEDWSFSTGETVKGPAYFPEPAADGPTPVQVVQSGPDQELKSIREIYFAAVLRAKKRLWMVTPYFVPDAGLRDALCLAGRCGIDVRLMVPQRGDKFLAHHAAWFYFGELLAAGVKIDLYTPGMHHAKLMLIDGEWASVGTANLDNRSLHLNFEVNCLIYDPACVVELEEQYRRDLEASVPLTPEEYARRPLAERLAENACRLFSPVL